MGGLSIMEKSLFDHNILISLLDFGVPLGLEGCIGRVANGFDIVGPFG